MKIILIRPPRIEGYCERRFIQQPINLAYIAAYLKKNGWKVELWDYEVEEFEPASFQKRLELACPRVVGITGMTPTINNAHQVASQIKKYNPNIKIIIGGPHSSALPEKTLSEFINFDVVVIGEGEATCNEICQRVSSKTSLEGIKGIAYRNNGKIKIEEKRAYLEDVDSLPYPDRGLFNRQLYSGAPSVGLNFDYQNKTEIFTSRGCAFRCIFCAIGNTIGFKTRLRSTENILGEIKQCIQQYGYKHIGFEDTNFTSDPLRLYQLCQSLKELKVTWNCQTRVDLVNKDVVKMMAESGCKKIAYGVESGSPRILGLIQKKITLAQIKDAFRWTKESGIITCGFFMLGSHPSETKMDVRMTERLINQIRPDVFQLTIAVPYPGSALYEIMKEKNYLESEDWAKFNFLHSLPTWHTEHFSARELIKIQRNIYIRHILIPKVILQIIFNMFNRSNRKYYLNISKEIVKYLFIEKRK